LSTEGMEKRNSSIRKKWEGGRFKGKRRKKEGVSSSRGGKRDKFQLDVDKMEADYLFSGEVDPRQQWLLGLPRTGVWWGGGGGEGGLGGGGGGGGVVGVGVLGGVGVGGVWFYADHSIRKVAKK